MELKNFTVSQFIVEEWTWKYAPLNVEGELCHADEWLTANPKRKKKNIRRFLINWLNRSYAKVTTAQVQSRMYARAGTTGHFKDYSQECADVLKKYPDLAK
jgi:hypothetical protein